MSIPQWLYNAVFYQIFPDRFANGDPSNDPPNVKPWGVTPTRRGFQGGDLRGITENLDYLLDLGINTIYLNPIFMAASTHRYDTIDYFRVDPKLGDLYEFHSFIEATHQAGIRVILDGVFNHCARGFFAFNDILENGPDSPYINWFHILRFPLRAYDNGHARNYRAWWGIKSLPKFNTDYPPVRRYLLDVARYWIEQGADGWRLDVPNEIDDDGFWAEFRQTVRTANPDAYILGEIWEANPRWVGEGSFDGLMNYPVRTAILDYMTGKISAGQFGDSLDAILATYPQEFIWGMYNLLGSHDTERVLTHFHGDNKKLILANQIMFAFPGAPAIYYGDEIGLLGGPDPDCRRTFSWDPSNWNYEIHKMIKHLIFLRKTTPALQTGCYRRLDNWSKNNCFVFARKLDDQIVIVTLNPGESNAQCEVPLSDMGLPEGQVLHSLIGETDVVVQNGHIHVSLRPQQGEYLAWNK